MRLTINRLYAYTARVGHRVRYGNLDTKHGSALRLHLRPFSQCSVVCNLTSNISHDIRVEDFSAVNGRKEPGSASDSLTDVRSEKRSAPDSTPLSLARQPLPVTCPGCGALSQETASDEAGHYTRSRKAVRAFLKGQKLLEHTSEQDATRTKSASEVPSADLIDAGRPSLESISKNTSDYLKTPVCDRCHNLVYNSQGQSIAHPSVEDLADSIAESPFDHNHVYHVLDAADFPMSLVPGILKRLELAKPRSQNRRSRHKFTSKPTMSFIITRSDLLGSKKELVDRLMPYFQSVLRTALGRSGRDIRLGNVHLVSAKRGWWTKDIKESIWKRGGGNWMIGRVNVGKSNLFEVLFPKGSGDRAPVYTDLEQQQDATQAEKQTSLSAGFLSEDALLPPAQPEVPYPAMPIVSSLPGTTASPIRLPFGDHRGELIDLPGLERGNLEEHVQPDHKLDLVMQHRPNVEQHIIKPGQSLLLGGGLVRITPQLDPNDRSTTMLAYPFIPIDAHVTATEKAVGTQLQQRESGIKSILADGSGQHMSSAGMIGLTTDVTKLRAGPLMRAGVPVSRLPFRIFSTDILIEGVGWVELVCQVRKRRSFEPDQSGSVISGEDTATQPPPVHSSTHDGIAFVPFSSHIGANGVMSTIPEKTASTAPDGSPVTPFAEDFPIPQVEIFSPHGRHLSQRKPMGAWLLWDNGRRRKAREAAAVRPRKPMKGEKKRAKERLKAQTPTV